MKTSANQARKEVVAYHGNLNRAHQFGGSGFRFNYQDGKKSYRHYKFTESTGEEHPLDEEASRMVTPRREARDEQRLDPYDRLAFATEVSIRYHNRRKQHYDNAFRSMMMGVILLAGMVLMMGIGQKLWVGLGIIGLAAGTLVWNVTSKAREHDVLRSEYQTLFEQIRMTPHPTEQDIRNWRALRLRIQTKEPPVFWAVANDCYYDVARAWDVEPKRRAKPPAMLRPFANWFRF